MNDEPLTTEVVWHLFSANVKNFLRQRVSDEQTADELLQETFLRIHTGLEHVEQHQRIAAWVFQIARNLVVDHYRTKARDNARAEGDSPAETDAAENLNLQVAEAVAAMIRRLPADYRQAIELYELEGLSQPEIAKRIGLSHSGAKSRVQRGRLLLKEMLRECCSLEQDCYGNIIECVPKESKGCDSCE